MDNQLFRDIPTDLDLNGPILSFNTQPTSLQVAGVAPGQTGGPTATFTVNAIATFDGAPSSNTGTIAYQWYGPLGVLTEGTKYVGTKTSTLQVTNVTSPTDVGAYYAVVDYVPSSETGNAVNEPLTSDSAELTSFPVIEINAQPTTVVTIPSTDNNFNINATLSDNGTDIGFQWQLDGENVSDGTITKSTVEEIPGTTQNRVSQYAPMGGSNSITVPAGAKNVVFEIAGAAGGTGGGNFPQGVVSQGGKGGRGGRGMTGWFHIGNNFYHSGNPNLGLGNALTVGLYAGRRGNDGMVGSRENAAGGNAENVNQRGGPGGAHGWGGTWNSNNTSSGDAGGGGGGGASSVIMINGSASIIAGGGGGGGGAFNSTGSQSGNGANGMDAGPVRTSGGGRYSPSTMSWVTNNSNPDPGNAGSPGHDGQGSDTPGGGGGGAGAPGGGGGHHGHRPSGSPGGVQGMSSYMPNHVEYRSGSSNPTGGGWAGVHYTVDETAIVPTPVTRTTTVSGSATNQLTLNTDGPGIGYTVKCNVSSSIASNSPVASDEVDYHVESTVTDANLTVEGIGLDSTVANISTTNLVNGELTLDTIGTGFAGPAPTIQLYSLYSPDKDLDVEMDLWGGGASDASAGEGGFGRIRFTMKQNEEYIIAGLTDNVNTPFLYRKAALIACVGEAGRSGVVGQRGGNGGGINIPGADAPAGGGGGGGQTVQSSIGGLSLNGKFGSAYIAPFVYPGDRQSGNNTGGHTISCTKGVYFRQQGLSPCQDILDPTESHFRLPDGREAANTGLIHRGYKSGYNIIQTAGGPHTGGFRGGNGAKGGNSGTGAGGNSGGGGGSGYGDGSVTVVSTTQGGSTTSAKVVIRVAT